MSLEEHVLIPLYVKLVAGNRKYSCYPVCVTCYGEGGGFHVPCEGNVC